MSEQPLFQGDKLRLAALNPETDGEVMARWKEDTEFYRLLDADAYRPSTIAEERSRIEREETSPDTVVFGLRTLTDDQLIGFVALDGIAWHNGTSFIAIGIGERDFWGKGYGTDAMRLMVRYGFEALRLRRISLDVFEYNPRAYHSYLKAGFKDEGRLRGYVHRDGRRSDVIFMGILREDWLASR